jgi:hypothetical protein
VATFPEVKRMDAQTPAKTRFYRTVHRFEVVAPATVVNAHASVPATFQVTDQPFVCRKVTWQIRGYNGITDPTASVADLLAALQQDGQLSLELLADNQSYALEPIPFIAAMGGGSLGQAWLDLPAPIIMLPKQTIKATVHNNLQRGFGPITVVVVFAGEEPDTRADVR